MYTIKKASELTRLSGHTLRFYDKEGLLPGLTRDGAGRRIFSDADLENVRTILSLREMGLPLSRIRDFIKAGGAGAREKRAAIIAEQMERTKAEIADAKRRLALLTRAACGQAVEFRRGAESGADNHAAMAA